ncbi:uncharacterized protein MELLADRAFT_115851 [Melampsora larici-populina 98AG31]|uniref:RNase III domain-containing protein n=1 Tax=Melampsora larici-populina (strain 98AG31 / pathotype 3-4-7) TaxID=747676 RepID=F4REW9_MELLP|nr:uncharacterized protein MELLADRAFT_115851 [Melampsora larici-populina 98AG31]EGG09214.1 hypothetical protein MELLADRAFT_115851 [Melampsora larici-populina 98AG31]
MKAIRTAIQLGATSGSTSESKIVLSRCRPRNKSTFTQERSYTNDVSDPISSHNSRSPSNPKKVAASFKVGPYRGAILSPEPSTIPSPTTPTSHLYSPSKLRQILKPAKAVTSRAVLHFPHSKTIKEHLEELLFPLQFTEQLACRIVSSKNLIKSQASLDELKAERGDVGYVLLGEHNTKLSFLGRRMMHFALSDFLINAPIVSPLTTTPSRLSPQVLENALLTKFMLGQYVGNQWELEKIMRWRELDGLSSGSSEMVGTGLWTARGHTVEAILGAVMLQHGTRLSLAVFHSLVLPHLSFRLDPAFLPAIKAIQLLDRELERSESGLSKWKELDITPFSTNERNVEGQEAAKVEGST